MSGCAHHQLDLWRHLAQVPPRCPAEVPVPRPAQAPAPLLPLPAAQVFAATSLAPPTICRAHGSTGEPAARTAAPRRSSSSRTTPRKGSRRVAFCRLPKSRAHEGKRPERETSLGVRTRRPRDRNSFISRLNFRRETAGSANCGSDTATTNSGLQVQE